MYTPARFRFMTAALVVAAGLACDSPTEPTLGVIDLTLEAVGDAAQLTANVMGSSQLPRWESLDDDVVTVTEAGMAVAVAPGTATVRARIGSRTAEGTVTVLPPVDVELSQLAWGTDPGGMTGMTMRLRNLGGRGFFRMEYWKQRATPDGEHQRILYYFNDVEAPVGMDVTHGNYIIDEPADWVVVQVREPRSVDYVVTSCVRLDGGQPCPMD